MAERLDARIAELAAQHNLGYQIDVYRTKRPMGIRLLWILTGVAAALALVAFWGDVAVVGYALVPLTVLGYIGFARLVPPRGGRRWLVLFAHGFVEGSALDGFIAVGWKDVQALEQTPGRPGGITIAYRTEPDGEPKLISVDTPPRRRMFRRFEVCLRMFVIEQARIELHDHGSANFAPLVITARGLTIGDAGQLLPWEQVARVIVEDDRLTVSTTSPSGLLVPWFEGQVPHATACRDVINEVNPRTQRFAAAGLVDELVAVSRRPPSAAETNPHRKHFVGLAVLALVIPSAYAGYARLFLPEQRTEPPYEHLLGEACGDKRVAFKSAAKYEGAGPHAVVAHEDIRSQPGVSSPFPKIPAEWQPQSPTLVQLVACVRMDPASAGRTIVKICHGQEALGGFESTLSFYWTAYQIDIYEVRTGKKVGGARLVAGEATCPESWQSYRALQASSIEAPARPSEQAYRDALRRYVE